MSEIIEHELIPGFEAPVHRALTEPILLAGAPRAVAILNGTLSAAIGLGLRLWIAGLVLWAAGHMAAVWAAKRDPSFVEVVWRPREKSEGAMPDWPDGVTGAIGAHKALACYGAMGSALCSRLVGTGV
jgi:type IV secretory pathway TrbD component